MMSFLRSRKVQLGLAALVAVLVPARIAYKAYRDERRCFVPQRHEPHLSAAEFGVTGLQNVAFPGPGGTLRGVFAPPQNGATVVLTHGSLGEHSDMAPEARILGHAGYGVLAFDWPGHGQSDGKIEWSESERQALSAAVAWLVAQPGVDPSRLGVFGFSSGGHTVAQVAARDPRLRAVVLASAPPDPLVHLHWEYRQYGPLSRWPARLALMVSGMKTEEQVPEQVIGKIAPRPLLLIGGVEDQLVPNWMTQRLFAAAHEPKAIWLVPKAGHGGYAEAAPVDYPERLLKFFGVLTR